MLSPTVPLTSGTDGDSVFTWRRRNLPLISCRVCQVIPVAVEPLLTVKASSSLPTGRMTTPTTASVSTWSGCRWERRWCWTSLTWAWRATAAAPLTMLRCVCVFICNKRYSHPVIKKWVQKLLSVFSSPVCIYRFATAEQSLTHWLGSSAAVSSRLPSTRPPTTCGSVLSLTVWSAGLVSEPCTLSVSLFSSKNQKAVFFTQWRILLKPLLLSVAHSLCLSRSVSLSVSLSFSRLRRHSDRDGTDPIPFPP